MSLATCICIGIFTFLANFMLGYVARRVDDPEVRKACFRVFGFEVLVLLLFAAFMSYQMMMSVLQ